MAVILNIRLGRAAAEVAVALSAIFAAGTADAQTTRTATALPFPENPPMARRAMAMGRTFDAESAGNLNPSAKVPKPLISSRTQWGALESSGTLRPHRPLRIMIHHEGTAKAFDPREKETTTVVKNLQIYSRGHKDWGDIPYHYLIDPDGMIFEGREIGFAGATNTTYDPAGWVLISLIGNYEIQSAPEKELVAIANLGAWLCDTYNIDPASLRAHRDVALTDCPGKYVYPFVVSGAFEGEIRQKIAAAYRRREETTGTVTPSARAAAIDIVTTAGP